MEIQKFTNNATTSADMLRKYQDMIVENQGDEDLEEAENEEVDESKEEEVDESKEEEVDESKEEEVDESTHFSLSQVNNASILRKYQDILKEAPSVQSLAKADAERNKFDAERNKFDRQTRSNAEFDAAYDEMFGDESDDPNSGMLDTFWRSEDEVRRDKRKRYADTLRQQGLDTAGDAEEAQRRTNIRQKGFDKTAMLGKRRGQGEVGARMAPTAAQIAANPGYKHSSAVAVLPTIGGPNDHKDNSAYNDDEPESALASTNLAQPAKAPVAPASQAPPAFPPDPKPNKPTRQQPQTPPDPSAYVDSWRKSTKKKTTPLDVRLNDR